MSLALLLIYPRIPSITDLDPCLPPFKPSFTAQEMQHRSEHQILQILQSRFSQVVISVAYG